MATSNSEPSASRPPALRTAVVLVAAGSGERLGYGVPKAQVPLAGEPILGYALRGVIASGIADRICVAVPRGDQQLRAFCEEVAGTTAAPGQPACPPLVVVEGGSTRADSVRNALRALDGGIDAVLVHDAARALTPPEVFQRVHQALAEGAHAVIPARVLVDTVKVVQHARPSESHIAQQMVERTADRAVLRTVQTPQGFRWDILVQAHASAEMFDDDQSAAVTDDAMLVEALGADVFVVPGSELSLKITTPTDLVLAEALLQAYGS